MKSTIKKLNAAAMMIGLTSALTCFAQGTQTGGGRAQELALEHMMLDLIPYLESSEGRKAFPEVAAYDQSHPKETFSSLLRNTSIVLVPGEAKDRFDADRDCVSYFGDPKNRYIRCNQAAVPDATKLENQPLLYSFLFHEVLVQAKLEKSRNTNIPSDYHISKRMDFHKETFEKYLPGPGNGSSSTSPISTLPEAKAFAEAEVKRLEKAISESARDPNLQPCDFYALQTELEYNQWFLNPEHYRQFEEASLKAEPVIKMINGKLASLKNRTVNVLIYKGQNDQAEVPVGFRDLVDFFKLYDQRLKKCPKDQRQALIDMMETQPLSNPMKVVLSQLRAAGGMMSVNLNASLQENGATYELLMNPQTHGYSLDLQVTVDLDGIQQVYRLSLLNGDASSELELGNETQWQMFSSAEIDGMPMDGLSRYRQIQKQFKHGCSEMVSIPSASHGMPYVKYSEISELRNRLEEQGYYNPLTAGMDFVAIKKSPHFASVAQDFEIQTTEITQEQWYRVMKTNPSQYKSRTDCPDTWSASLDPSGMCPDAPVENVTWMNVSAFVEKLNVSNDAYLYRIPTEMEWDYAARGGMTDEYLGPEHLERLRQMSWFAENAQGFIHNVATGRSNEYGLYDMHGNVLEWTSSAAQGRRTLVGGSVSHNLKDLKTQRHGLSRSTESNGIIGFRIIRIPR